MNWYKKAIIEEVSENPIQQTVFHGTDKDFPENELESGNNEIGVHFGTEEHASNANFNVNRLIEKQININKPLRLKDKGSQFTPFNVAEQLMDLEIAPKIWNDMDTRTNLTKNDVINTIEELGYDGIVYLNRVELPPEDMHKIFSIPSNATDEEFLQSIPNAKDSYILFE